jgi:sugar/nucleoside kinase (ribokinase family)
MFDVISIGAATVDIFVKSDSLKIANNLLSVEASSKNEIKDSLITSGGGATNSSVSFSRLGLKSACISLVGQDPLTQYINYDLTHNKVHKLLITTPESTDYSVILVADDGSRTILTNRGTTRLEISQINFDQLLNCHWLYISSLEGNFDLLEHLIGFALENKIKIALNPGRRELSNLSHLQPLLKHLDFLLVNGNESEILTGINIYQSQFPEKLLSFGAKINAVTNGRDGAYIYTSDGRLYSPILNVHPVDETGAGDAFGSTFVASLIHENSLETSLEWGIKNSASVVSFLGAKPGLLTLDKIK